MKPRTVFILFLISVCSLCNAQKEANVWYFGTKAGIDFNTSPPTPLLDGVMTTFEGCASIADDNGNLLFYTDGSTVWNKSHTVMTNGTGLNGNTSSTQSGVIIPQPGNDSIYFIFTASGFTSGGTGYYYSKVNVKASSGNGTILDKNTLLLQPSTMESIGATVHQNGRDIWVFTKDETDKFYAYLVTPNGISSPVISTIGPDASANTSFLGSYAMKISPNGQLLAIGYVNNFWALYKLNSSTGQLTDFLILDTICTGCYHYSFEFSPNSQFLYANSYVAINQYDVSSFDGNAIENSKVTLYTPGIEKRATMQLGPDSRIYVATLGGSYLDVIKKPNSRSTLCEYSENLFDLNGRTSQYGLPAFIQSYFQHSFYFDSTCFNDSTTFYLDTSNASHDSIRWDFGDTLNSENSSAQISPKHKYKNPGTYTVNLYIYLGVAVDTLTSSVQIVASPKFSLNVDSAAMCPGDTISLQPDTIASDVNYLWTTGDIDPSIQVTKSGLYVLTGTNSCGSWKDSTRVSIQNCSKIITSTDTCHEDSTYFTLGYSHLLIDSVLWNFGEVLSSNNRSKLISPKHKYKNPGRYIVNVYIYYGATIDTLVGEVNIVTAPNFSLGDKNVIMCDGDSILLRPDTITSDVNYLWTTGDINPRIQVTKSGQYTLTGTNSCGSWKDSTLVTVIDCTISITLSDTCYKDSTYFILDYSNLSIDSVLWNFRDPGSNLNTSKLYNPKHQFSKPGSYLVTLTIYTPNGVRNLSHQVQIIHKIAFTLPKDTTLCMDQKLRISPNPGYFLDNFLWSTGENSSFIIVEEQGIYTLYDSNLCNSHSDSIEVSFKDCDTYIFMPNIFTPNGDGLNDLFSPIEQNGIHHPQLSIYNRWGELIFESYLLDISWDGKSNNKLLPSSTYFWILNYKDAFNNDHRKSGIIELTR